MWGGGLRSAASRRLVRSRPHRTGPDRNGWVPSRAVVAPWRTVRASCVVRCAGGPSPASATATEAWRESSFYSLATAAPAGRWMSPTATVKPTVRVRPGGWPQWAAALHAHMLRRVCTHGARLVAVATSPPGISHGRQQSEHCMQRQKRNFFK